MRNRLSNKRVPTILGIILILLGIPLTTFIIKNQTTFKGIASNSQEPQNIKITNISDRSFTLTYQTNEATTGSISYGHDKKLGESELDDIDKEKGSFSPKKIHSISVKKLTPATKYYLTITSGSNTFLKDNAPLEVMTGPEISSPSAKQNTIKGKIVLPDGNAPSEALIYLNADNSQFLSTTAAKDGKFSFSLKELRTKDLSSYFNTNENTIFKIVATNGSLKATALTSLSQKDSIPTMTLSNDYDFVQEISSSSTASESAQPSGFPSITLPEEKSKPQIISPLKDQTITEQKPLFRGTSLPNEKVEIIIRSEEITAQVTADGNGNWTYQPSTDLSPGEHTITIKTRDSLGILTTIIQSFTVFAADSQISQPATPSATPTQTTSPTPTVALTPFPSPTITISIPIPTPTFVPSPTVVPIASKGGIPPTGNSPISLIVGGVATAILGIMLFLLTRTIL